MKAVASAEASAALYHGVDEVVDEVESCLELSSGYSGRVSEHLSAADIEHGFHAEILSSWLLLDT